MKKQDIIKFFDQCAPAWDGEMIRDDQVIDRILKNGGICPEVAVLDVACGTGVLFPDYLRRGVESVTGVDISPEMARIAAGKKLGRRVTVICGDIEELDLGRTFDCCMVYNAFPHFPDPENLIRVLAGTLRPGGTLSIAHGMSRAAIDRHHADCARKVSMGLMHEKELAKILAPYFRVEYMISDDTMYQVCGVRK